MVPDLFEAPWNGTKWFHYCKQEDKAINKEILKIKNNADIVKRKKKKMDKKSFVPGPTKEQVNLMNYKLFVGCVCAC